MAVEDAYCQLCRYSDAKRENVEAVSEEFKSVEDAKFALRADHYGKGPYWVGIYHRDDNGFAHHIIDIQFDGTIGTPD